VKRIYFPAETLKLDTAHVRILGKIQNSVNELFHDNVLLVDTLSERSDAYLS